MKDIRVYLPVFLLIIIVLLLAGCGGITPTPPSPGTTDDVTTISGQILMPTICCLPLPDEDQANTARNGCDETEFWAEVPDARVVLRSAQKCKNDLDETFADSSGYYEFEDVKPGLYIITAYCTEDEGFLVKDVALKVEGEALDAGIPDCTSTGIALVMEKINGCYNDWYQCFNKYTAIYKKVDLIAGLIGNVNIPNIISQAQNIESIEDLATAAGITDLQTILGHFGDVCDADLYGLVDMICEWSCCIGVGATGGGGGGPTPGPTTYTLTLFANPEEGALSLTGDGTYNDGTDVQVDTEANPCYEFLHWTIDSGDPAWITGDLTTEPLEVEMNGNVTLTAHFGCPPFDDPGLVINIIGPEELLLLEEQFIGRATLPKPLEICMDECATITSVTIKYDCQDLPELVITDLEDIRIGWAYNATKISFDKETGKVCLIGGYETGVAGTYSITATFTDPCGTTVDGSTSVDFVDCRCDPLSADAGPDQCIQLDCGPQVEVFFDGSGSSGTDLTYEWDFDNDGVYDETGQNPSYMFSAGTYTVTLTVTDSCGNSESDTMELNVLPACDLPDQLTVSEISTSPSNYYLKVKFSDGSGDVLSGSWYYGWCAHSDLIGIPAVGQQLYVYCTLDSSLELADYWPKINWIINNRAGYTKSVVQDAVWHYINGKSVSGSAATLVGLANSHPDFCPAIGDKFVVLLTQNPMDSYGIYSKSNEQPILIEVIRENHCEIPY